MNGVLIVNKKFGVTSRDVVNDVCHIFKTKKVGHTGTLDPIATGVLVVTVGKYTKLNDVLMSTYKEYVATMKLGVLTDTLDITGNVVVEDKHIFTNEEIINAIASFKGEYLQEVPKYSAIKINGKKLYDYARNGEEVELPKRNVVIREIEVLDINGDEVTFRCVVSKGTYIRSLIRDIASRLGTYGTMKTLKRTMQGNFSISNSFSIEDIRNGKYSFLKIENVLDVLKIEVDDNIYKCVYNGVKMNIDTDKDFILYVKNDEEISLYKRDNDSFRMFLKLVD